MARDPELEVRVSQPRPGEFEVALRFEDPDDEAERPVVSAPTDIRLEDLEALRLDLDEYGRLLGRQLLAPESEAGQALRDFYRQVRAVAEQRGRPLRWRLQIAPSAIFLQSLRWELLRDPDTDQRLATGEHILFSRFVASRSWRQIHWRSRSTTRALIAVSAPADLGRYRLAPIDREAQIARVGAFLKPMPPVLGGARPCTLAHLVAELRQGVECLYLVCHGALRDRHPHLLLEDDQGNSEWVEGGQLAERLRELLEPPRLIVLVSCESGGREDGEGEGALAVHLVEAGVSAVLAMGGKISMATADTFMPAFFRELQADGRIDRAVAVARGEIREAADSWMPMLLLRLKSGRLWYDAGFDDAAGTFDRWRSLVGHLRKGRCVPILGPGYAEHVYGSPVERAWQLVQSERIPAIEESRDMAKIAQYLALKESPDWIVDKIRGSMRDEILRRHPELSDLKGETFVEELLRRHLALADDPLRILAGLQASLFICATQDTLLLRALKAAGREPVEMVCRWRKTRDHHPVEPPFTGVPSAERPVVYFPFGVYRDPETLVLTEDDYLDFMVAATRYQLIPTLARGSLVQSSLLFLGFSLDELAFRCLFRFILALDGSSQLAAYAHVGVQIDPHDSTEAEIDQARNYLKRYFGGRANAPQIHLYWGSVADFLAELQTQQAAGPAVETKAAADSEDWL